MRARARPDCPPFSTLDALFVERARLDFPPCPPSSPSVLSSPFPLSSPSPSSSPSPLSSSAPLSSSSPSFSPSPSCPSSITSCLSSSGSLILIRREAAFFKKIFEWRTFASTTGSLFPRGSCSRIPILACSLRERAFSSTKSFSAKSKIGQRTHRHPTE